MEEGNEMDKVDDVMLPGFRFHPTDEELVGFYLKSKVQNKSLPIELIRQVDIYKYDPWDLPKELATTEEKEWYFYCQRDRKYRNSTRPNRVTGAGFWKATGTDRPIYSSDTTKCIGLKKSLVFYRGRAAKGIKTDWMMHEFRLPSSTSTSTSDSSQPNKLFVKSLPLNDSWAICRIFKKTNTMAQRALSHSWVPGLPEIAASDHMITQGPNYPQFSTIEVGPDIQFCTSGHLQLQNTTASYNNKSPTFPFSNEENFNGFVYSPPVLSGTTKSNQTFMLLNPSMMGSMDNNSDFGSPEQQLGAFSMSLPQVIIPEDDAGLEKIPRTSQDNNKSKAIRSIGFPFSLSADDDWNAVFPWDSPSCPSEMSTSISTNSCYY